MSMRQCVLMHINVNIPSAVRSLPLIDVSFHGALFSIIFDITDF